MLKRGIMFDFQSKVAGSSPVIRSIFRIDKTDRATATTFLAQWHYIGTASTGTYYGCYDATGLAGVAVVKGLSGGRGKRHRLQIDGLVVRELSRFALRDDCPKNSESHLLSRLARRWRQENIDYVVAYADPVVGHRGTIYHASNWIYLGRNYYSYRTHAYFLDGKEISDLALKKHGAQQNRIALMRHEFGPRFEIRRAVPKHVFVLPLTRRARDEIQQRLAATGDRYNRHSGAWGWYTPRGRGQSFTACDCIYVNGKAASSCTQCGGRLWIPKQLDIATKTA